MVRVGHVVLVLDPVRLDEQAQRLQGVNSGGGSSISSRWVQYVKVADLEAASRQRPLMAGTARSRTRQVADRQRSGINREGLLALNST